MGDGSVSMMICLLALGSGTLLFSVGAGAIPGRLGPEATSDAHTAGAGVSSRPAVGNTVGSSVLTSEPEIPSPKVPELRKPGLQLEIPCLHGFSNETPPENNSAEHPCTAPAGRFCYRSCSV